MKKSALAAAITLLSCATLASCGGSTPTPDVSSKGPQEGLINIRVYNLDSVSLHYELVEKLNNESEEATAKFQSMAQSFDNQERQRAAELQNLYASFQDKVQKNQFLTQASMEASAADLQRKEQALNTLHAQHQQTLQDMQNELVLLAQQQQQQLIDSINNFLKAYTAVNPFDAILVMQPGTYYSDQLDITDEVIKGLNDRYKGVAPATTTPAPADSTATN